ncbi:YL1-domain-containing protein [Plenodomus tracheiphilus IPT5]|uniref:YL1-domain-containing protein n=1 Tax=Plenodomus tracheiphilus IPT5 TaxID=1408161 RepID=A0A6A7BAS9_9PLEO|nr:YL1-domain-containing protein [Plenodomus tracheiphilus IPT5]
MSDAFTPAAQKHVPQAERDEESEASEDDSGSEAPVDLMVTTRARRSNAGNRMSTLLAKSAEQEEEWGEEWEDAPNEEDFRGGDVNEQEDYNIDSSSSEEDDDGADEDDAGEKELRKAERQEKSKKRKATTNPFAARVAAATRKKVKLDVPHASDVHSPPSLAPPRPKKKSERASWIPTVEDGPVRTSSRKQTVANKETTMAKLKEKDRRRDDTLAMMKAAEARKAKAKEPPLTQAQRLAEAARNERINKKTLHRWEEAEEARAAERQAKIDALKNRQIDGPFIRFYSGPAIWVDDKIKYTGKDAPTLEQLEEKVNQDLLNPENKEILPETTEAKALDHQSANSAEHQTQQPSSQLDNHTPSQQDTQQLPPSTTSSHIIPTPTTMAPQQDTPQMPWAAASHGGDIFMGSHGISYPNSTMFAHPPQDSFLFGIDQYAQNQQTTPTPDNLPPNPFTQASPYQQQYAQPQHSPFPQVYPSMDPNTPSLGSQSLQQSQKPPPAPLPPAPPRRKVIRRALRNLLILSSFPDLDPPPQSTSSRSTTKTPASLLKEKDRTALIHLSSALFNWSPAEASTFVTAILSTSSSKPRKKDGIPPTAAELAFKPSHKICPVTNLQARYKDPETGMSYRDVRAFGVLRGVVGGGFVWSGELGCFVGGRARPLESMGGKGFLGMPPAKNVPRRFGEMGRRVVQSTGVVTSGPGMAEAVVGSVEAENKGEGGGGAAMGMPVTPREVKTEGAGVV